MADCIFARPSSGALLCSLALLAGGVCLAQSEASSKVTAVRFWSLGEVTRVAIEVSSEFKFKSDRLTSPDRLFFDIQGARPEMAPRGTHVIPVGDPLLKQIRIAELLPGVTRLVLDLSEQNDQRPQFTASQLSSPNRLMIELRLKDKPEPPATSSFSGVKTLTDDVVAVAPPRPAPRKFEPPPQRPASKPDPRPVLLSPPPALAVMTKPVRIPSGTLRRDPPAAAPAATAAATDVIQPLPAKRNAAGGQSLTRVLGLKLGRVVLDPGHGGHDVGTHGPSGLYEKDVVLDVAHRLGELIEARLGSDVVFTRSDDTFIPLEERTQIANDHKADLFLSIHANSSPFRAAAGVETYYLNFTTTRAALDLAARENAGSGRTIFDLKEVLAKIALKDKIDESREFAARLQNSLYAISSKGNAAAKNRGVKKAPFVVLIGAEMPSVLAEIGFLTNSGDEAVLRKTEQRQKIAEALYKGIAAYAETLSRFQVAQRQ